MARLDTLALRLSKPNDSNGAALTQAMEKLESSLLAALKAMDGRDEPLAPALEKLEATLSAALARTHAAGSEQTREALRELTEALAKGGFGGAATVKTQAVAGPPPVPAAATSNGDAAVSAQLAEALNRLAGALSERPAGPPATAPGATTPPSPAGAALPAWDADAPPTRHPEGAHAAVTGPPPQAAAPAADPRFDAVLERLDRTLRVLAMQANARRQSGERASEGGAAADMEGFEQALGRQAAMFERALLPLVQSSARNIDNATAVNARLVELLDTLKLFLKHGARQD